MVKNSELFDMFNALKSGMDALNEKQSKMTERITGLEVQFKHLNGKVLDIVRTNSVQDRHIFDNTKFRVETDAIVKSNKTRQEIDLKRLAIYVSAISASIYIAAELVSHIL